MNLLFELPTGWYYYDYTNRPRGPFESREEAEETLMETILILQDSIDSLHNPT